MQRRIKIQRTAAKSDLTHLQPIQPRLTLPISRVQRIDPHDTDHIDDDRPELASNPFRQKG
jgi:hypothetical protein